MAAEGVSMKEVIRDDLHTTIKSFERGGLALVVLAILMNVPWIAILEYVATGLTATANPPC